MQVRYILREGFSGFKRAKLSMFAAVITVSISLLLLSSFTILLINANSVIESLRDKVEMEAFLEDGLRNDEVEAIEKRVLAVTGVREVRFISKEEAARIFEEEFGEDIYRVLDFNPLPASVKIYLIDGYKTAAAAASVYDDVKQIRGVEDVIYRKALLEMLDQRAKTFLWGALGIGLFITISSIFLVANTIRLAIYAKRKIIQSMKLIGATRSFIRTPFIVEGLVQGCVGGLFASGVVFVLFNYLEQWLSVPMSDFVRVEVFAYGLIVGVGCLLGFLGSVLSIRRFIGESVVS
ncbi:MAG: ABC transporter permease [Ignavibacteriales bacterium]|nr:ABC transporter permease [Ignavibacteriales bacterium]